MYRKAEHSNAVRSVTLHLLVAFTLLAASLSGCIKDSASPGGNTSANPRASYKWDKLLLGADLSWTNALEDYGAHYLDSGVAKDPFLIFRQHGANLVRVRLWHTPAWQDSLYGGHRYSDLADAEITLQRARQAGMALLLDLHYSDTWADPAHQEIPAAWKGLPLATLQDSVYQYTLSVLQRLNSKGLVPEIIQLGNEINGGLLFPLGKVVGNDWSGTAALLQSAIHAVRDFSAGSSLKPRIMLHVAQWQNASAWLTGLIQSGHVTDFDIVGVSHYYVWSSVNSMADIADSIRSLKTRFGKAVLIAETAYPWTASGADSYPNIISGSSAVSGYPVSPDGQYQYLHDLTQTVIRGGGMGLIYWEPEWISTSLSDQYGRGSPWENNAFFDFSGNNLPALNFMSDTYSF